VRNFPGRKGIQVIELVGNSEEKGYDLLGSQRESKSVSKNSFTKSGKTNFRGKILAKKEPIDWT